MFDLSIGFFQVVWLVIFLDGEWWFDSLIYEYWVVSSGILSLVDENLVVVLKELME